MNCAVSRSKLTDCRTKWRVTSSRTSRRSSSRGMRSGVSSYVVPSQMTIFNSKLEWTVRTSIWWSLKGLKSLIAPSEMRTSSWMNASSRSRKSSSTLSVCMRTPSKSQGRLSQSSKNWTWCVKSSFHCRLTPVMAMIWTSRRAKDSWESSRTISAYWKSSFSKLTLIGRKGWLRSKLMLMRAQASWLTLLNNWSKLIEKSHAKNRQESWWKWGSVWAKRRRRAGYERTWKSRFRSSSLWRMTRPRR